ncbi:hypothetical protein BS78_06G178200 [Paspalum vaginatum]|nr:hypothetical protein BS78_06G178200 [Paspalum vaginatum]
MFHGFGFTPYKFLGPVKTPSAAPQTLACLLSTTSCRLRVRSTPWPPLRAVARLPPPAPAAARPQHPSTSSLPSTHRRDVRPCPPTPTSPPHAGLSLILLAEPWRARTRPAIDRRTARPPLVQSPPPGIAPPGPRRRAHAREARCGPDEQRQPAAVLPTPEKHGAALTSSGSRLRRDGHPSSDGARCG